MRKYRVFVVGTWAGLRRMPACGVTLAAVASLLVMPVHASAAQMSAPQLVTITIPAPPGEIASQWLTYPGPPRANVLLPAGYDPHSRYPLLVLLNGLANNYASYQDDGLLSRLDGLNAIVVMPEGGNGWYADWWNDGTRGSPGWESYELDTVLPTILARYPILPQRRYHAIAGFSMGGLGAVYLGGRLPGFFGSVASLSGFDDPGFFAPLPEVGMAITSLAPFEGNENLDAVYGPPFGFYSRGHNPPNLATNLGQTRVFESTGTGVPSGAGHSDPSGGGPSAITSGSALESLIIYPMNEIYHRALTEAGVDVTYQVHAGGHDIPDFFNEWAAYMAWNPFKPVPSDPLSWTNNTVATSGQLWDVSYHFDQPPTQVVEFHQSGLSLSISGGGSGVTITTAGGCVLHAQTPATVSLPFVRCG